MPTKFIINDKVNCFYEADTQTFNTSEKYVRFDSTYEVVNPKTGGRAIFEFSHATGPEFDPLTKWIYKSALGLTFAVWNDAEMTARNAANYLASKTQKS